MINLLDIANQSDFSCRLAASIDRVILEADDQTATEPTATGKSKTTGKSPAATNKEPTRSFNLERVLGFLERLGPGRRALAFLVLADLLFKQMGLKHLNLNLKEDRQANEYITVYKSIPTEVTNEITRIAAFINAAAKAHPGRVDPKEQALKAVSTIAKYAKVDREGLAKAVKSREGHKEGAHRGQLIKACEKHVNAAFKAANDRDLDQVFDDLPTIHIPVTDINPDADPKRFQETIEIRGTTLFKMLEAYAKAKNDSQDDFNISPFGVIMYGAVFFAMDHKVNPVDQSEPEDDWLPVSDEDAPRVIAIFTKHINANRPREMASRSHAIRIPLSEIVPDIDADTIEQYEEKDIEATSLYKLMVRYAEGYNDHYDDRELMAMSEIYRGCISFYKTIYWST